MSRLRERLWGWSVRGLLLFAFLIALAPLAISIPYVGVLVWSWLSFMSPHRETFSFTYDFHIVIGFALAALIGWAIAGKPKLIIRERTILLMILFVGWTAVTTATAIDQSWSYPYLIQNSKSFLLAFAVFCVLNSKTRMQSIILVIAVSLGYFAVKGFGFTLLTGGGFHVGGPGGPAIEDNNNLGLALCMSLPLLNYLRISSHRTSVSLIITFVMLATAVAVIGTYSRGGLFGLAVVSLYMWLLARHKVVITLGVIVTLIALPNLVPQAWYERMSTISTYTEDLSFDQRVQAWAVSLGVALDRPLTGGGFKATEIDEVFTKYNTRGGTRAGTAAHSIYFEVLGEHGFIGFGLYALMVIAGFRNLWEVARLARGRPDLRWIADLAGMMQVAFIGVLSAGTLLSMAYSDVFLVLIALSARMRLFVIETVSSEATLPEPSWRRLAGTAH
jgi:probable O-glycosylation ligase (exosortase A-associated)